MRHPSRFLAIVAACTQAAREQPMRGVVFTGGRELELMEFPDPTPGPDEVVVEMKASGMCGSDLHKYRLPKAGADMAGRPANPVIMGHEPCGIIAALGPGVTEREARVGQRVMVHHYPGLHPVHPLPLRLAATLPASAGESVRQQHPRRTRALP